LPVTFGGVVTYYTPRFGGSPGYKGRCNSQLS